MLANIKQTCEDCGEGPGIQVVVTTEDRTVIGIWCNECIDAGLDDIKKTLRLGAIGMAMLQANELKNFLAELDS